MKSIKLGIVFGCFMVMLGCNYPTFKPVSNVDLLFLETTSLCACPSDDSMRLGLITNGQEYWVQCLDCNTPGPRSDNYKGAIEKWNTRSK